MPFAPAARTPTMGIQPVHERPCRRGVADAPFRTRGDRSTQAGGWKPDAPSPPSVRAPAASFPSRAFLGLRGRVTAGLSAAPSKENGLYTRFATEGCKQSRCLLHPPGYARPRTLTTQRHPSSLAAKGATAGLAAAPPKECLREHVGLRDPAEAWLVLSVHSSREARKNDSAMPGWLHARKKPPFTTCPEEHFVAAPRNVMLVGGSSPPQARTLRRNARTSILRR